MVVRFVEEDTIIDVKLVDGCVIDLIIINIDTPVSLVRREWIDGYFKETKVDKSKV